MPGRKPRTSRTLLLIAVMLCLIFGGTLTQSSANPSPISDGNMPDMFVAKDMDDSAFTSKDTVADTEQLTDDSRVLTDEPENTPTPKPTKKPSKPSSKKEKRREVSPEASKGVWTPSGSSWLFLVNGNAFTGWLCDTDNQCYYFNKDGIMQIGWLDEGGKRYYLDADGIMQVGDVKIGKETYHFLADGSLEGYEDETASEEASKDAKKKDSKKDSSKDSTKKDSDKDSSKDYKKKDSDKDSSKDSEKKDSKKTDSKKKDSSKERKTVALTFDDGPSSFTDRLLDCLKENNAKATFFLAGQEISNFPETVKRMDELGHEIGNHTYSHVDLTSIDASEISNEIGKTDQILLDLVGHGATVLRPPFGSINDNVVASVGTPMILWSIDTLDWQTRDPEQTIQTVMENVKDGDIILMHDIFKESVEAAETLIPRLIEEGYDLVTVHQLAKEHNKELKTGIAYGAIN